MLRASVVDVAVLTGSDEVHARIVSDGLIAMRRHQNHVLSVPA